MLIFLVLCVPAVANGVFPIIATTTPAANGSGGGRSSSSAAASKALEMFMVRAAAQNPLPIIAVNPVSSTTNPAAPAAATPTSAAVSLPSGTTSRLTTLEPRSNNDAIESALDNTEKIVANLLANKKQVVLKERTAPCYVVL